LICSDQNVLEAEVPDGSLTGASMSKVVHKERLSQLFSQSPSLARRLRCLILVLNLVVLMQVLLRYLEKQLA
jgi:hypothetical protein